MTAKDLKSCSNASCGQKAGLAALTIADVVAKTAVLIDIYRRPAEDIRGPKWVWVLAQALNGVGPASYWMFGRK
ncbi:PLDc N-terminal domain-containing protein [Corynebacterium alimapuense]|uniref:Cardiolipin synthase N-terminal domain-containing protein n=1 Tax=Corynebacterium alimapuense TaxID=1576874 RepID=A0A3M8K7P8_9CORY|nr:PLDc N-terminal domain-containing protein [Corynebacterium alimapuense]RNE49176.1 hypothetical protein C5L39_01990 [Corynebacterium alimapuense]